MNLMENRKLTICLLGSAESIHMLKWAKFFSEAGHSVHLISYVPPLENYDLGKINIHLLKKAFPINIWPLNTILNLPFTIRQVRKAIKRINPDIVNAHYITSYGSVGVFSGFRPLVLTAWGSDILVTPRKFLPSKWAVKYFLKKADLITCDAEHMKGAIVEFGVSSDKVKIINFGIDTKKFIPGSSDKNFRKKIGFSDKDKIVISLRSLEPVYNIETLISAVPKIVKEIPTVKFIIIGKGTIEQDLKKMADKTCPKGSVKFLGKIQNDNLPDYLQVSDVYVSTSLSDGGIAASTAEAMACELPVVITDSADNRSWINDNENGFIIPIKNPGELAQKVCLLLKDAFLREKIGKAGRRTIVEKNDYYKEMLKIEKSYYELINK